ncbi:MAG: condensation domain-containing protein [Candidatus Xenobia bacterium]
MKLDGMSREEKRALLARLMKERIAPCVPPQESSVAHQLMLPQLTGYNIRSTLRYHRQRLDPARVRANLQRIVDRHGILRTSYKVVGQRVVQELQPQHEVMFEVVEAQGWTAEALRARLLADACRPYQPLALPVFRVQLYRWTDDDILQIEMHHAAADVWGMEIIVAELEEPAPGPPPPGFKAFAERHCAYLTGPQGQADAQWWKDTLRGAKPVAFGDSSMITPAQYTTFAIDPPLFQAVSRVARAHHMTLYTFLLSCLQAVLKESCGHGDISVITPAANRDDAAYAESIGFFAVPIIYRQDVSDGITWEQLWQRNRVMIAGALDHQGFPALHLAETPRIDVIFMFQKYQRAKWIEAPPGVEALGSGVTSVGFQQSPWGAREQLWVEIPHTPFPVCFETLDRGDRVSGTFRWRETCMPRRAGEAFVRRFMERVVEAVGRPAGRV